MTITLSITDEKALTLQRRAEQLGLSLEQFAQAMLEESGLPEGDEFIDDTDEKFARAAEYVLNKNAELYRRLA